MSFPPPPVFDFVKLLLLLRISFAPPERLKKMRTLMCNLICDALKRFQIGARLRGNFMHLLCRILYAIQSPQCRYKRLINDTFLAVITHETEREEIWVSLCFSSVVATSKYLEYSHHEAGGGGGGEGAAGVDSITRRVQLVAAANGKEVPKISFIQYLN